MIQTHTDTPSARPGTVSKTKWSHDPVHSEVTFRVKHMMIANVQGSIADYAIDVETDGIDFTSADISFTAITGSVTTGDKQRDAHLRSADFFDAEKFPVIIFKAKGLEDGKRLTGDLTMHGVTRKVTFAVDFGGITKDPWGKTRAGFAVTGIVRRTDFGLTWNSALETGGVLVSEEVRIHCEIELVRE